MMRERGGKEVDRWGHGLRSQTIDGLVDEVATVSSCRAALVRDISQLKRRSERRHREVVAIAVLNREQSRECCGETVRLYEVRQQRQWSTDGLDERSK
jgi:hypothetical protein